MKKDRHAKVLEIVKKYDLETQEELAEKLREAGYDVTQATVSRDIRALRLTKVAGSDGKQKYAVIHSGGDEISEKSLRVLRECVQDIDKAENIIVVKTLPGMAMAVAASLDALKMKDVVGTIAGDDTIMMAIRSKEKAEYVLETIYDIIHK